MNLSKNGQLFNWIITGNERIFYYDEIYLRENIVIVEVCFFVHK
jgi:hypothetical protein